MKIVIDIPNSLYANLSRITIGSSASARILNCVKDGRKFDMYQYHSGFMDGYKEGLMEGKVIGLTQLANSILEKYGGKGK